MYGTSRTRARAHAKTQQQHTWGIPADSCHRADQRARVINTEIIRRIS